MLHTLTVADESVRTLSPTTTVKMARRMLAASKVVRRNLPKGFHSELSLDMLLEMYVAEDHARYLKMSDLAVAGDVHPRILERWIAALVQEGLIAVKVDYVALTSAGDETVTQLIEELFHVQRSLDG